MPSLLVGWAGNALQILILCHAFRTRTLRIYPYFYAYIASSLSSAVLSFIYTFDFRSYGGWYWPIQLITLLFGCGVILEIFDHVLSRYPGAERFARFIGLIAFGSAGSLSILPLLAAGQSAEETMIVLERNLRTVQAIFLFAIFVVISHYSIPIGRNIKGMIRGYAIYVGASLLSLAVWAYAGSALRSAWLFTQPITFVISLLIWLVALWSYSPNPVPEIGIELESDYELLVSRTRRALDTTRSYLGRATRL